MVLGEGVGGGGESMEENQEILNNFLKLIINLANFNIQFQKIYWQIYPP